MMWSCRKRLLPLVAAALLAGYEILVSGQSSEAGFINIDCGKERDYKYTDPNSGLTYTSDFDYVDSGEIHNIDPSTQSSGLYKQAYDLRSFPNGTRNCFTVKQLRKGSRYLVKTSFMYGNYDGKNSTPKFDLYLGVNFWETYSVSDPNGNYIKEILTVTTSDQISICLVNSGFGVPFISVIELRPLPSDMYDHATSSRALVLHSRDNFGGDEIRYPNDPYDRFWDDSTKENWKVLSNTSPVDLSKSSYKPPSDVMKTAIYPSRGSTLDKIWDGKTTWQNPRFHVILHFAELQQVEGNQTRNFRIVVNGETFADRVNLTYLEAQSFNTRNPISNLEFSLVATNQSTLPPIINAAEVYYVVNTTGSETDRDDVDAATAIKDEYKVQRNWMGDPCSPAEFRWDGINCSNNSSPNFRIISMKLSSSGLTGKISTSFEKLSQLQYLDLSNNELTGGVPDALANLTHLKLLDLSGNRLNGYVPQLLLDRSTVGYLTLRIDNGGKKSTSKIVIAVIVPITTVVLFGFLAIFLLKRRKNSGAHLASNQFTADDLARMTNNFDRVIGRGGFGTVYHGVLDDGTEVAVKKLRNLTDGPDQFKTEVIAGRRWTRTYVGVSFGLGRRLAARGACWIRQTRTCEGTCWGA